MTTPRQLVLVSRSFGRGYLLRQAGYAFKQVDPGYEDPAQPEPGAPPAELAMDLARRKVLSHPPELPEGPLVLLSGDTLIVTATGAMVGTPTRRDEAAAILRGCMGHTHTVISGAALVTREPDGQLGEPITFVGQPKVTWGQVSDADLEAYLDSETWRGKAGGYNLWDRRDAGWPLSVAGEEAAVVGLPMDTLEQHLDRLGVHPVPGCLGGT